MDWLTQGKNIRAAIQKYKYVVLVVALGIVFMMIPDAQKQEETPTVPESTAKESTITEELTAILAQIEGVGKVRVMITEESGSQTFYQTDEDRTEGDGTASIRKETVIVSGNGKESGLIQTVTPPVYLGAIVVCQGADNVQIRLAVINAVSAVTGISTDRISVLKMK